MTTDFTSYIVESIKKIEDYTRDGREAFMNSPMAQDAVVRNFEIIGEAVKQIPGPLRKYVLIYRGAGSLASGMF